MTDENRWLKKIQQDPGHSAWYIDRFRSMAAAGDDLAGEARMIDAMVRRADPRCRLWSGPGRRVPRRGRS
jgi:hypothetical protein